MAVSYQDIRNIAGVTLALALGIGFAGYYTAYLRRQELKDWQKVKVAFVDVGGLKTKSGVMVEGHVMGRVNSIQLYKDRQMVILDLEPSMILHENDVVVIVPTSALGFVGVEIDIPRAEDFRDPELIEDPDSLRGERLDLTDPDLIIEGKIRSSLGGGTPTGEREKELKQLVTDMAALTDEVTKPDGGLIGQLVFDPARAEVFSNGLAEFERSVDQFDEGLAGFEQRSNAVTSEETLLVVRETTRAMSETFRSIRDSLRETLNGEGTLSTFVADPNFAVDFHEAMRKQRFFWRAATKRDAEGLLGSLLDEDSEAYEEFSGVAEAWNKRTGAGLRGEGTFALLGNPQVGDEMREILRNTEEGLEQFRKGPLIDNPEAKQEVEDLFGNADDLLNQARRALRGFRSGFPDRTFAGAAFAIF